MDEQEQLDFVKNLFRVKILPINSYIVRILGAHLCSFADRQNADRFITSEAKKLIELAEQDNPEYKDETEEIAVIYIKYKLGFIERPKITAFQEDNEFEFLSLDD